MPSSFKLPFEGMLRSHYQVKSIKDDGITFKTWSVLFFPNSLTMINHNCICQLLSHDYTAGQPVLNHPSATPSITYVETFDPGGVRPRC